MQDLGEGVVATEAFLAQLAAFDAADPELAATVRELLANLRQAMEGVKAGRYPSVEAAMQTLAGDRWERVE